MASGDVSSTDDRNYIYSIELKPEKLVYLPDEDVVDSTPMVEFNVVDTCLFVSAAFFYLLDVGTDITLANFYYFHNDYIYFGLTLSFIILPSVVTNVLSIKWYLDDRNSEIIPTASKFVWILRLISHLLLLGVLYRSFESQYYGWQSLRSKTKKKYFNAVMTWLDADISLLKLFEAFFESAPQLVLQLYIIATNALIIRYHFESGFHPGIPKRNPNTHVEASAVGDSDVFRGHGPRITDFTVVVQVVSVIASLISISSSLTSYARNQRFSHKSKQNMSWTGTFLHFFWRLGTVGARVLALALFASAFTFWCAIAIFVRWMVMTTWIWLSNISLCGNKCQDFFMNIVLGLVYIFAFLNPNDKPTFCRYLFYYSYEVIEDTILISLWCWVVDLGTAWFFLPALIGHFGGVIVGLITMAVYYAWFHPNGPRSEIRFCGISENRNSVKTSTDSNPSSNSKNSNPLSNSTDSNLSSNSTDSNLLSNSTDSNPSSNSTKLSCANIGNVF